MELVICLLLVGLYLGTYLESAATTGSSLSDQA